MRIPFNRVSPIAAEMMQALTSDKGVETETPREVQIDLESVLRQYIRDEQALTEKAKDVLAAQRRPPTELGKVKRHLAEQNNMKVGDDAVDYILDQLVEILMHSNNVEEIWVEDVELRRRMRNPLRRQMQAEEEVQEQVRGRLRHVKEGTSTWEVEYRRMMDDIRRRKGL